MAKFDSKVVTFERNADYLRQRAMRNRREGKNIDALELMRQALEREPDNAGYALDLANLCAEMGLYEQTNRILMRAMAKGNAPKDCLYPMANNLYHRGDISRAERLLRAYIESGAQGERAEEASRVLSEIECARESMRPTDRKLAHAARIINQACDAMRAGNAALGERLFRKSIALRDVSPEVHALLALALLMRRQWRESQDEIERGLRMLREKPDARPVKTLCVSAQVLSYLGKTDEAREMARSALNLEADEAEARIRLNVLCEMEMHAEARTAVEAIIREQPYDKQLLHISSVAAYNTDAPDFETAKGWQRIARLDPADPVSAYFLKAAENGSLPPRPLDYAYHLPKEEMSERIHYLNECFQGGTRSMAEAWNHDARFREILEWGLALDQEELTKTSLTVLAGIEDDEARMLVRVYAQRPDAPMSLRVYALGMMSVQDISAERVLENCFITAGLPTEEEAMSGLPVGQKQMIRYAAEYVEYRYGDYPVADIALIWRAFMEARGSRSDPVYRTEAGSAALALIYLNVRGHADDIYTISRWYGCPSRQAAHIARTIRDVIGLSEGREEGE